MVGQQRCKVSAVLVLLAGPASAQVVRLGPPAATLAEEFSAIRGVRELPDGRLLVSDYVDERVVLVDFDRGSVIPRVRQGSGPGEARLPSRLVAFGDSTLLVDLGNNRLLVLDREGRPVRTIASAHPGVLGVRGTGAGGTLYYAVPSWADQQGELPDDSVRIVRWNPRSDREDTVAVIQGDRMRSDRREPALTPRIPIVGYAAQDAWVVNDGVMRIVRAGGYRVETRAPGAAASFGPAYAYPTRAVTAAERLDFVRRFLTTSPIGGKGPNGGLGHAPAPTEAEIAGILPGTQFAARHPMFNAGDLVAAPDGMLWVGRPTVEGAPVRYDVFDEAGRRTTSVEVAPGRRVLAVGRTAIYAVAESDLGLQRLERYSLPPGFRP
jgi:hypothetical protein